MDNPAQKSMIGRKNRGARCNRTLRAPSPPRETVSGASPMRRTPRWLTEFDAAASHNERALLFWLDTAARYHTDPAHDVIVALKTIEGPTSGGEGIRALYVWEVSWCRERDGIKWRFIVWDVSGYGVRFRDCASRDEAMALYSLSAEQGIAAVQDAPGVYLRPECQPA